MSMNVFATLNLKNLVLNRSSKSFLSTSSINNEIFLTFVAKTSTLCTFEASANKKKVVQKHIVFFVSLRLSIVVSMNVFGILRFLSIVCPLEF